MFTATAKYGTDNHTEFYELGEVFSIYEGDDEKMAEYKKQYPDATSFMVGDKIAIPIMKDITYEIYNSKGTIIKTLY